MVEKWELKLTQYPGDLGMLLSLEAVHNIFRFRFGAVILFISWASGKSIGYSYTSAEEISTTNSSSCLKTGSKMSTTSSSESSDGSPSLARSRWGLLQQAILKKTIPEPVENPASKRNFEQYSDLVSWKNDITKSVMNVQVRVPYRPVISSAVDTFQCTVSANNINLDYNCAALYPIQIHRNNYVTPVDIRDLKGLDRTGRICIWPSEQVLAYWCLRNRSLFEGKKVLEIGGGFHCLAGLALAKYSKAAKVVLTDGDKVNIEEVSYSIERNSIPADSCHATTLRWDEFRCQPELENQFDYVIAADVVYESSIFSSLLQMLAFVLKVGGQFILFNPTRDGILDKFLSLAQSTANDAFSEIRLADFYDETIYEICWTLKQNNQAFNKEWHYPKQVTFKKIQNDNE